LISLFSTVAVVVVTFVAAIAPAINLPGQSKTEDGRFPAPPGYLLPWAGGEIHTVTQGEETSFTHNRSTAYAFDFDMSYDTIVAARSGKVSMVREDSNSGGCSAAFSSAANYVVIDHGDGTSALYLHVAYNGVTVAPGDVVDQGDPIAISGETGLTCSDSEGGGPGPHLHFQVQRTEPDRPLTQSVPVAFDDIPTNKGVPEDGRSYVSGNFGKGKPQKIKLTPWRVPRVFNPVAQPANPDLLEEPLAPTPTPEAARPEAESIEASASATMTETPTITPVPDDTHTPTPDDTNTPEPSRTAPSTDTAVPETPVPDTAVPDTATAPPVTDTPPPDDTPPPPTVEPAGGATTEAAPSTPATP
jgi:murein DD-endopeptidase MepM/ murein hydrolase activator NlpD